MASGVGLIRKRSKLMAKKSTMDDSICNTCIWDGSFADCPMFQPFGIEEAIVFKCGTYLAKEKPNEN
jgi:hypothetical protein